MEQSKSYSNTQYSQGQNDFTSLDIKTQTQENYKMYPSRWGVFATVLMFNLTNNCLFISFGAVGTKAAEFYDVDVEAIDLLSSTYLYVGIPCCFAMTWIIDRFGLR